MSPAQKDRVPATPDEHLDKIRKRLKANRQKIAQLEKLQKDLGSDLDRWKRVDSRVTALQKHGVIQPWMVLTEADRAEAAVGGLDVQFDLLALAVLRHETGIPQRPIFGGDHGDVGDRPPYYHQAVTHDRGVAFLKALHADVWANMNGVHWPQTTWYEKVYRVAKMSADLTDPQAHLRVCLGDLAVLVKDRGLHDGVMGYNGAGPAAETYVDEVLNDELPVVKSWLPKH